jgi:hypothetical protein
MISRFIKVIYGFEPPRIGVASPSSVRNPYLTFLTSRTLLRFNPFDALGAVPNYYAVASAKIPSDIAVGDAGIEPATSSV